MKKKFISLTTCLILATTLLIGCGDKTTSTNEGGEKNTQYTIGISQFAEHSSLDNCREGFIAGLADAGIVEGENLKTMYDNSQASMDQASLIANNFVQKKVDLICGIATPSAMTAYNACRETDIPVVYTAVSDPEAAGLTKGNVTGSSDVLPVKEQLAMIHKILPNAKKIGIIYTSSEENSLSTIKKYKELAGEYGFEIVEKGITTASEVGIAASDLVSKVDCISNLTDNTVVSALQTVISAANEQKIPVFGSEIEQVKDGCLAAMGIDYFALGKETGALAAKILKGEKTAAELPFITSEAAEFYVNTGVAEKLGITLDPSYLPQAKESFGN
ncbi:ABC transporter substrate-binding protein [Clostridia bacterium]|nr:ABC transporter substrate-binding protein [Clostridia bacterium]